MLDRPTALIYRLVIEMTQNRDDKMTDMTYRQDGIWTHFMPVSDAGLELFKQFLKADCDTILSIHDKGFIAEMRRAGYVVQKARKTTTKWTKEDDALLADLMA